MIRGLAWVSVWMFGCMGVARTPPLIPESTPLSIQPVSIAEQILWYDKPTNEYMSGLPVGNGHVGAMVLGEPAARESASTTTGSGEERPAIERIRMAALGWRSSDG